MMGGGALGRWARGGHIPRRMDEMAHQKGNNPQVPIGPDNNGSISRKRWSSADRQTEMRGAGSSFRVPLELLG